MLLIRNGFVIDPKSQTAEKLDVLIHNGRILKIGKRLWERMKRKPEKTIHADGLIVAPGLVDIHVHFRDPGLTYKEDIESGASAAAAGGFTSVVMMANTKPPVDSNETLQYVLEQGKKCGIHVYSCACVTKEMKGLELTDLESLSEHGAAGFTDDGVPVMDEALLKSCFEIASKLGKPVSLHEENPEWIKENGINAGDASKKMGLFGSQREAEISMVARDIKIAAETSVKLNLQHISTKEAVELIREAKKSNSNLHAEAAPHHFSLTEEAVTAFGTLAKMNPPLRTEEDRKAVIEGIKDGTIDIIATDHAPHSKEEKDRSFADAPSGITGLETALPLGLTKLVQEEQMPLIDLLARMTCSPAELYDLNAGYLAEGGPADLVIFSEKEAFELKTSYSKSKNSPFFGVPMHGQVCYTISAGEIVFDSRRMKRS